jgi:hypothetical protein
MTSPLARCAIAVLSGLAPACTMRPPVQSSGPAISRDGVQLAVTSQQCTQTVEPDNQGSDLVEEIVEVQVRNASASPLTVRRDAFHLVAPDGTALTTQTWRAFDPLTVEGGQTRTFELRFMTRGSLACAREMTLDADTAVRLRERVLDVGGVRFVPSRSS